jgi:hypothetical protein
MTDQLELLSRGAKSADRDLEGVDVAMGAREKNVGG